MASDIKEAIRRLIYKYTVEGADKVMATQEAVAASTTQTDKASLSLEKSFGNLERRYVDTVRAQQDYSKVQEKVNAAVAQNPALQERANAVLAAAGKHFDNIAAGATKGSMAATALARTLSRTIGPLALIGVAVAGISSAMEFMEPIAVRVGTDIYRRFSEAYPATARLAEGIYNAGKQFIEFEQARAKVEAIDAALRGVASSAQLAALKMETFNQEFVRKVGLGEAALAAQRIADHMMRLREIYPGVTQETAKQLELLDAQLRVAQARTDVERQIAEEKLRQVQLTQQGVKGEEQQLVIAREREIAEEKARQAEEQKILEARKALEQQSLEESRQRIKAEEAAEAQAEATRQAKNRASAEEDVSDAVDDTADAVERVGEHIQNATTYTYQMVDALDAELKAFHLLLSLAEQVDQRLRLMKTQFAGQQFELGGMGQNMLGAFYANLATMYPGGTANYNPQSTEWNKMIEAALQQTSTMEDLTDSTDSLNATMQNALSPFYSQDPRTTHLGFRAGVVGNPEWQVGGASNSNPLAAILGPGATAPGMAGGGSFVVGGGYSANDNRIAAFPVASGEEVIVNRNRAGGDKRGQVIHIDNRTIINGSVDVDVFARMKVSKYQQAQRMRAGLGAVA